MQEQDQGELEASRTVVISRTFKEDIHGAREVDWLALGVVVLMGGVFALLGRLSSQPATSLVPVAVLSTTGCGLLVTALRKLHTTERPGLLEAAVGGLFLALFQFLAAISYPGVAYALSQAADERLGFLSTWALIGAFAILFSMIGAILGHLAFGQMRTLAERRRDAQGSSVSAEEEETADAQKSALSDPEQEEQECDDREDDEPKEPAPSPPGALPQKRSLLSYAVAVILLGLAPTMVGYVFAAAFDYMLQLNLFFPGPYPTIRLLSALLPWQIPIPFSINSSDPNAVIFLLWQLWRIPLLLGNPTLFDVQSLEPFLFNGAALALLLCWVPYAEVGRQIRSDPLRWPIFLCFELLLGLLMVLPADALIVRGLQGLLQGPLVAIPIRTLHILDQFTFILNLITGPLTCVVIGGLLLFLRRKLLSR